MAKLMMMMIVPSMLRTMTLTRLIMILFVSTPITIQTMNMTRMMATPIIYDGYSAGGCGDDADDEDGDDDGRFRL